MLRCFNNFFLKVDPKQRRQKIIDLLNGNEGKLSLKELSIHFNVSQSALYKDLEVMQRQRLIKKVYGGLELMDIETKKHDFYKSLQVNSRQKVIIGKEAVKLIKDNETIFADGSSTTFYFCEELKKADLKNITIVTNSIFIPQEFLLENNFNVICTGGMLNKDIGTFGGDLWETIVINNLNSSKFFFSSFGISIENGALDPFIPVDSSMKKAFAAKSSKNICLADSSKFNINGTVSWIGFDYIDTLITDALIEEDALKKLKEKNIQVIVAGKNDRLLIK
jgi:DeoR family transcriptional regulator, glycerol-3-phosphate regulon repressor